MKSRIHPALFAGVVGVAIGWVMRGTGNIDREVNADESRTGGSRLRATSLQRANTSRQVSQWLPKNDRAFLNPESPTDRAEIQKLMQGAIGKEPNCHTRMKAVADLLALRTPENAYDIRDPFLNSRKTGFWYGRERKVFLARYGEVLGLWR